MSSFFGDGNGNKFKRTKPINPFTPVCIKIEGEDAKPVSNTIDRYNGDSKEYARKRKEVSCYVLFFNRIFIYY